MFYDLYTLPFFIAFFISALLCAFFVFMQKNRKCDIRRENRHIHKKHISRFGGVAIISAFILTIFLDKNLVITSQILGVIVASMVIVIVGIWDDLCELDWKVQLFLQAAIIGLIFLFGFELSYIPNPFGEAIVFDDNIWGTITSSVIVFVWILLLMNAMNWIDGIDGFSGGISFVASLVIFLLSLKPEVNQPPIAIIAIILAGAILGFLVFNFYPAKIFAGTSGSLFFGFILAALSIIAGTKIATTLLVVAIPVVDALWVIVERIKKGKSIFTPDKRHIHHVLLELGWSQFKIVIFFSVVTMFIGIVAIFTHAIGKAFAIIISFILIIVAFFYLRIAVLIKERQKTWTRK